ncbi:expressed unknown protein [Seminavis robusta]|uniref:Uncharacterized protein n=1 Tax=Seminavis robusta TaxID=568900 RepID=A0A9N8ELP2_9STRA|nr:expressed unknown protein [Seminavis robusta]|eukprot:Sro1323_g262700.1 n/a (421) ;mRNA; f:21795-23245
MKKCCGLAHQRRLVATNEFVSLAALEKTVTCRAALGFSPSLPVGHQQLRVLGSTTPLWSTNDDDNQSEEEEAARLQKKASELRDQIRQMEEQLGGERKRNYEIPTPVEPEEDLTLTGKSLRRKRVLVVGANGRLGSMVCRYLLRNTTDDTEVIAAVHYVGEDSYTSRGYGRLSYEVGAEDGVGNIGAAWSAEDRVATFQYTDEMKSYNLQNLRLVEVELLNPTQCDTITEGVDSVIWCATDYNDNQPRAVSGLNVAFLFRAVTDTTKGRVEIEGLQNILGSLKKNLQETRRKAGKDISAVNPNDPVNMVLVSPAPGIFGNFETPFGEFNAIKRQGEQIVSKEFPSLTHTVLQMGKYEDNFVEEDLELLFEESSCEYEQELEKDSYRVRINRRDAARAAVQALTDEAIEGKIVKCWTALRG